VITDSGSFYFEFVGGKPHVVLLRTSQPRPGFPLRWFANHYKAQTVVDLNYYTLSNSMLNKAKWMEAQFWLTDEDIEGFDHFTPVYIAKYGAYFYVNKIKNFVSGELTKCELVKL